MNKNILSISFICLIALLSSCSKGYFYTGINDDQTQLKNPTPKLLLPPIQLSSGYEYGGDESRFATIFVQQVTGDANQSYSANIYNVSPDDVDNMWSAGFYVGIMENNYQLIQISQQMNQKYYYAIGEILMALHLQRVTDLWGDIPYSKAFLGEASKNAPFDSQQSIYDSIFVLLNRALATINAGDNGVNVPGSEDYLYGGDMGKWSHFAHAIKARSFLHLVKQNPSYYDSAIAEIPLAFVDGTENAVVPFSGSSVTSENPTEQFNSQRGDIVYSGTLQNIMKSASDPRIAVYFGTKDQTQLGTLYGSANSSVPLMTYDELKFIEAEAQYQQGNKDAAAAAYNAAIKANLLRTIGDTSYLANVSKTSSNIGLNDIMTQKYIALFLRPESWTDWRRTGLPALSATTGNVTGNVIPRALVYPSSEVRYNSNTPKGQTLTSHIWWDK